MSEHSSSSSSEEAPDNMFGFISREMCRNPAFSAHEYVHSLKVKPLKKLIMQAIRLETKDVFDLALNKLETISQTGPDKEFYEECFRASVNCSVMHFIRKILQINKKLPAEKQSVDLLSFNSHIEAAITSTRSIARNEYTRSATSPLLMAIKDDNYQLVCKLIEYGANTCSLPGGLTAFMWSIVCNSDTDIQKLLITYTVDDPHDPFKNPYHPYMDDNSTNYIKRGLIYGSPVILDILNQFPDACGPDCFVLAVNLHTEPYIVEKIFELFDHDLWRETQPESALMFVLRLTVENIHISYIQVILNNERKLKLDIDYENSFELCPHYFVSFFYLRLYDMSFDEEILHDLVLHLLSHGAVVHTRDVDRMYNRTKTFTPLLKFIISNAPLANTGFGYNSLMYFKYTLIPDIKEYLFNISSDLFVESLTTLVKMYAFSKELQNQILDKIDDEAVYHECKLILENAATIPSLLQLSRDTYLKNLCQRYDIKTSCQLHTIIREIDMPQYMQDLITFNKRLYF